MAEKKETRDNRISMIAQISIILIIGVAIIGLLTSLVLYNTALQNIRTEFAASSEETAADLEGYINHFPAHDWLLTYWYENHDKLDPEYENAYGKDSETAKKYALLQERHPDFIPEYATGPEVRALPPEDQKLYAEIVYSWLIYRIDRITRSDEIDYVFCVATKRPYEEQMILFIADDEGRLRGSEKGDLYEIGTVIKSTDEQKEALHSASQKVPATAYNEDGKYLDYFYTIGNVDGNDLLLGVTRTTRAIESKVYGQTLKLSLLFIAFLVLLAVVCLAMMMAVVVVPLRKVQRTIRLYTNTKDSKTVRTKLGQIKSDNEIGELTDDLEKLTLEIDTYMEDIEKITSENTRISTELELASRIQISMLPDKAHRYPDAKEFNVYGRMYAAREVGGDYYDHFLVDDDHLCMYIADVSGKGVPAALFMMSTSIILKNHINMGKSPAQILTDMNEDVCAKNPEDMFVTVWLGILELSTGRLTAANAGHEYPFIKDSIGAFDMLRDKHGFMIGGMDGAVYKEYEVMMKPGDAVFVYTDGLTEAADPDNNMFGVDRALAELNRDTGRMAGDYVKDMKAAVTEFEKGREPFDDLTMLCVVYWGADGPPFWDK